jgi:hypothetical protein
VGKREIRKMKEAIEKSTGDKSQEDRTKKVTRKGE